MNKLSELVGEFLELDIVKNIESMGIKVFAAAAILLAFFWIWRMLRRFIDRRLRQDSDNDEATMRVYKSVFRLIVMLPGILLALHILGADLSTLFAHTGLFAIAAAFMMKNIAENYVSGAMLRLERTIKPDDVLETQGILVKVKKIGFRATIVRSKDERDLVIPNSQLVQERVANYTYRDSLCRVETIIGVSYTSDLKKVREVLERACGQLEWKSSQHEPTVSLTSFEESAVQFKVRVWIKNPWNAGRRQASLNEAIWWSLKEAGIVIAYPQLDVHFDKALTATANPGSTHEGENEND